MILFRTVQNQPPRLLANLSLNRTSNFQNFIHLFSTTAAEKSY